jgi:hypothetical protein
MRTLFKYFLCLELVIIFISVVFFGWITNPRADASTIASDQITLRLPTHQELKGEENSMGGTSVTPFIYTVNKDETTGTIEVVTIANDFEFNCHLDQSLLVRDSVFLFKNPNMIKFLGHDKRVTKVDKLKKIMEIEYFLNGFLKGVKKIPYDQNKVDSDTLLLFLQEKLLEKAVDFNKDVIQKAKGLRVNAEFKLITTSDLQLISPQYTFPEQFKKISKQPEEVYVYVMELTGLPSFIYPYKYYFAYRKALPCQLIAYWGGALKEEEFGYILD